MIKIYNMDVMKALKQMPDESVDMQITSPPYWGLRDYGKGTESIWGGKEDCEHDFNLKEFKQHAGRGGISKLGYHKLKENIPDDIYTVGFCNKCGAWKGQLGLEPTFDLFIKHLCDIFDEVKRVLKKDGTCWVNLGDTYSGSGQGSQTGYGDKKRKKVIGSMSKSITIKTSVSAKCLCAIPERFIIEMINRGWILRNKIIWHKPNHMPTSVKDRFACSWEYLFMFSKSKKYYFDLDAVRVPHKAGVTRWGGNTMKVPKNQKEMQGQSKALLTEERAWRNPKGKNPDDMWDITTRGYPEAHFAVFPEKLVERPIKTTPIEICKKCGKPRVRITKPTKEYSKLLNQSWTEDTDKSQKLRKEIGFQARTKKVATTYEAEMIGWTDCGCNAGFKPAVIMDIFAGSGTTLKVARDLDRDSIGIEIKPDYVKLIKKRLMFDKKGNRNLYPEPEVICS